LYFCKFHKITGSAFGNPREITITPSKHDSSILITANRSIDIPEALVSFIEDFDIF
jgi:hypothetical protein